LSISILLVGGHQILREGLSGLIEGEQAMDVVGEASGAEEALELAAGLSPGVVIVDIGGPDLGGVESVRVIVEGCPASRVVALAGRPERGLANRFLAAGAAGFLLKDCTFDELSRAVRTVHEGRQYLSPSVAEGMLEDASEYGEPKGRTRSQMLTAKEREVVAYLSEGRSTREIADLMEVSIKTVETHRGNLMRKLDIRSIAELTKFAIREGLTSL
jgi:DNA-binding NarL/FixJ family response regulator